MNNPSRIKGFTFNFTSQTVIITSEISVEKQFLYLLKMQVFECEMSLNDACCFDSGPQYILLCGDVARGRYSVKGIQVAGHGKRKKV